MTSGDLADADVSPPSSPTSRASPATRGCGPVVGLAPSGGRHDLERDIGTARSAPSIARGTSSATSTGPGSLPATPPPRQRISTASWVATVICYDIEFPEPARERRRCGGAMSSPYRPPTWCPGRSSTSTSSRCRRFRSDVCRLRQPHRHGGRPYLGRGVIAAPSGTTGGPVPTRGPRRPPRRHPEVVDVAGTRRPIHRSSPALYAALRQTPDDRDGRTWFCGTFRDGAIRGAGQLAPEAGRDPGLRRSESARAASPVVPRVRPTPARLEEMASGGRGEVRGGADPSTDHGRIPPCSRATGRLLISVIVEPVATASGSDVAPCPIERTHIAGPAAAGRQLATGDGLVNDDSGGCTWTCSNVRRNRSSSERLRRVRSRFSPERYEPPAPDVRLHLTVAEQPEAWFALRPRR